jgi:Fic family protein
MFESTGLMEPMLPTPSRELEDLIIEMIQKASTLTSQIPNIVQKIIGELVRSMNCYYSNLIEGHHTHPYDIERALKKEYSQEIEKRNLQLEAVAHIEVQKLIDEKMDPKVYPLSSEYIQWLHREFCSRFPEDLLFIEEENEHASDEQ